MVNFMSLFVFYLVAEKGFDNTRLVILSNIITILFQKILPAFVFMLIHYKAFNPRTIKTKVIMGRSNSGNSTEISADNFEFI